MLYILLRSIQHRAAGSGNRTQGLIKLNLLSLLSLYPVSGA